MQRNSVTKVRKDYFGEEIKAASAANLAVKTRTLAVSEDDEVKWTVKMVEDHFREAILTLGKLPPVRQKDYFNLWSDIVCMPNERNFRKKRSMRNLATSEELIKLNQIFEWLNWVTLEEKKLIWKRAENKHWKLICWELGCDRSTAWRKWVIACTKIATTLNARLLKGLGVATK